MNRQHLLALFWLRWRIRVNQFKKGGVVNAVLLAVVAVAALGLVAGLFAGSVLVGYFALPEASPLVVLFVWDGVVVLFVFVWTIGLLVELQRSESLSLDKLMHLPVTLTGAFLINYVGSLFSFTLLVFAPILVGLALGMTFGRGPALLLLLPLLAALLLMVTALTYQFQSWLASLMLNKRRRRTVIVLFTLGFILLAQAPNLINILRPWDAGQQADLAERQSQDQEQRELDLALKEGKITFAQHQKRQAELRREQGVRSQEADRQTWQQVERTARLVNTVVPPGWMALGASDLAEGRVLPALLGTLGLTLIGAGSLWRAYRTTLRMYKGQSGGRRKQPAAVAAPAKAGTRSAGLLDEEVRGVPEQAAAIALSGFVSLLRAPEAKMLLLTPVIMAVVFGSLLLTRAPNLSEGQRPLLAFGAMAMMLFTMAQLVGNQFGFDRNGFRVFVLCPAPRRYILLGKNLAFAPLVLGLGAAIVVVAQVLYPMSVGHLLSVVPQFVSMYLLFCALANWLSLFAPMRIAAGSLKPSNLKLVHFLLHLAFVFVLPLVLVPTLLPLGAEFLLEELGWVKGVPVCLILSVLECAAVVALYRLVLTWQGDVLQAREKKILELVTTKEE